MQIDNECIYFQLFISSSLLVIENIIYNIILYIKHSSFFNVSAFHVSETWQWKMFLDYAAVKKSCLFSLLVKYAAYSGSTLWEYIFAKHVDCIWSCDRAPQNSASRNLSTWSGGTRDLTEKIAAVHRLCCENI